MRPVAVALVAPGGLWRAWTFDPAVIAGLAVAAALYAHGWSVLAGKRRQMALGHPVVAPRHPVLTRRQGIAFGAGLLSLAVALVSPLDALGTTLLSAHMAQHLILLILAPALLVYGRPGLVGRLGLPRGLRLGLRDLEHTASFRGLARLTRHPLVVLAGVTVSLWVWHLPAAYDAAVTNPVVHAAEHITFLVTALAYWRLVIDPSPRRRLGYPAGMVLTFVVMLQSAALGAVIALSPSVLYPVYRAGASMWGTTALGDQHLAGALMWIPPGLLYLVTIVALAARWFAQVERRTPQRGVPAEASA
jgi:putative membrane protein